MKQLYIKDLKKGDKIFDESFAIKQYKKSSTVSNKPYIDIVLADKTGTIKAKIWSDDIQNCREAKVGDIIKIDGSVGEYREALQLQISCLDLLKNYNQDDYIEKSKNDIDTMFKQIQKVIDEIQNKYLKKLLEDIFEDKEFSELYKNAAGAFKVHHAYSGGLLEHNIEVLNVSRTLAESFPKVNKDLLFAGVLLHDIGKMYEYKVGTTITISKEGKLLGHIFIGTELVKNKAKDVKDFPADLLDELLHLILSHHGELEFGSPIKPMTPEAVILWASDNASAKVNMAYTIVHEGNITNEFTEYHKHLGTELYRSPYVDEILSKEN